MPGGSHPPLQHVPPPRMANGSLVAHALPARSGPNGAGGGGGGGGGAVVATLQPMPGGNHPPLQHVPPPIAPNGSPVAHAAPALVPDGGGGGGAVVVGGGGGDVAGVPTKLHAMPGGIHPPLQHVPPPIAPNGSLPAHATPVLVVIPPARLEDETT